MSFDLVLITVLHVALLVSQAVLARFALVRRRLYGFFFASVALYQAVSVFTLPAVIGTFGTMALLYAEIIAAAGTLLVASFVFAGERLLPVRFGYDGPNRFEYVVARPGLYLAVIGTCVAVVTLVMFRNGLDVLGRTWQVARLDATYADSLATLLLFLIFPAAWIAARAGHRTTAVVLFVGSLILFVVYGTRAALLTLPMVVILDFLMRRRSGQTSSRTLVLIAAAALALHVAGRLVRGFGLAGLVAVLRGDSISSLAPSEVLANMDWSGGEAAIFRYFLFVVAAGPFTDIEPLTSVIRWLGMYVPAGFFVGTKPVDVTYTIWWHAYSLGVFDEYESFRELLAVVGAGGGGSLHPLIWGEMWVNGGWLAMPVFAFSLAAALLLIETLYARLSAVPFVLAAPATLIGYVMVARGNSVIGLGYTAYILPLALLAYGAVSYGLVSLGTLRKRDRPCD